MEKELIQLIHRGLKELTDEKKVSKIDIIEGAESTRLFKHEIPKLLADELKIDIDEYAVKGSNGDGKYVEIPWIAILNKKITTSVQQGIYIVLLFNSDFSRLYLSLNQGITYFKKRFTGVKPKKKLKRTAEIIRDSIYIPEMFGEKEIELNAVGERGKTYPIGHIAGKSYELENLHKDKELINDIKKLMSVYSEVCNDIGNRTLDEYYDYIIADDEGVILDETDLPVNIQYGVDEKIISTDNIVEYDKTDISKDLPQEKKKPLISKRGRKIIPRDKKSSNDAILIADFKCEVNEKHKSFISKKSGKQYVEAHHLIPLSYYNDENFKYDIDVSSNIVCLCPNCHKCIHLGTDDEKLDILSKVVSEKRIQRMSDAGIFVDMEDLKSMYKIK